MFYFLGCLSTNIGLIDTFYWLKPVNVFSVETLFPTLLALKGTSVIFSSQPETVIKQLEVLQTSFQDFQSTPQPKMEKDFNPFKSNFFTSIFGVKPSSTTDSQKKVDTASPSSNVSSTVRVPPNAAALPVAAAALPVAAQKREFDSGPATITARSREAKIKTAEDAFLSLPPEDVLMPTRGFQLKRVLEAREKAEASKRRNPVFGIVDPGTSDSSRASQSIGASSRRSTFAVVSSDPNLNGARAKQSVPVEPSKSGDQNRQPDKTSTANGSSGKEWPERERSYVIEYDVLRFLPSTSGDFVKKMFEKQDLSEGTLFSINFDREFGLIKLPNGNRNDGRVSFVFRNVVNLCDQEVVLLKGMKLKFSRDKKNPSR